MKLDNDMAVCFDTETFRWAAGWIGGYIDMSRTSEVRTQGRRRRDAGGQAILCNIV